MVSEAACGALSSMLQAQVGTAGKAGGDAAMELDDESLKLAAARLASCLPNNPGGALPTEAAQGILNGNLPLLMQLCAPLASSFNAALPFANGRELASMSSPTLATAAPAAPAAQLSSK